MFSRVEFLSVYALSPDVASWYRGSWGMEIARCLAAPLCFLMSARQSRRATKVHLDGCIDRRARGRRFMMVKAAFLRHHNRNG